MCIKSVIDHSSGQSFLDETELLVVFCQGNNPIVDVTAGTQLSAAAPPGNLKTRKERLMNPFTKFIISPYKSWN